MYYTNREIEISQNVGKIMDKLLETPPDAGEFKGAKKIIEPLTDEEKTILIWMFKLALQSERITTMEMVKKLESARTSIDIFNLAIALGIDLE